MLVKGATGNINQLNTAATRNSHNLSSDVWVRTFGLCSFLVLQNWLTEVYQHLGDRGFRFFENSSLLILRRGSFDTLIKDLTHYLFSRLFKAVGTTNSHGSFIFETKEVPFQIKILLINCVYPLLSNDVLYVKYGQIPILSNKYNFSIYIQIPIVKKQFRYVNRFTQCDLHSNRHNLMTEYGTELYLLFLLFLSICLLYSAMPITQHFGIFITKLWLVVWKQFFTKLTNLTTAR